MANQVKTVPVLIIGGGLTGLAAAARLEKAGVDYLIVEAQSEWGGMVKGQNDKGLSLDFGLKSLPVGPDVATNPLVELKKDLGLNLSIASWNELPKTFSAKGASVDFVGFGETLTDQRFLDELNYYLETPRLMVSGGWKNLVDELLNIIPEKKRLPQSIVTKIEVSEDRVTSVVINGEKTLRAKNFVFTLTPNLLRELLPANAVSGKIIQRIARTTPLTALSLDIVTEKSAFDAKNLFVLHEASKEKNEIPLYVIGQFISNIDPLRQGSRGQLSTWMTFVDPEAIADDESGSKCLKAMRKLIKKNFPELIASEQGPKNWERILVVPDAVGRHDHLTLEDNLTLPGLDNLWICGGLAPGSSRNLSTALEVSKPVSQNVIQALQAHEETSDRSLEENLSEPTTGV